MGTISGMGFAKKLKKNPKMVDSKKLKFSTPQILIFFAKISGIGLWFSMMNWWEGQGCGSTYLVVRLSDDLLLKWFFCFLIPFLILQQPDIHVGCAILMFFASIYFSKPRPNPKIFAKKIENWGSWKFQFFWVGHFDFFLQNEYFFASFPWKSVQIYMVKWMGPNFDVFPFFQKIPCYD